MDVASWLRSLGLEQYEAVFRENAIDVGVLPDLTDQDLEKLGVLLGHRRKLLRTIANLETTAKAAQGVGADHRRADLAEPCTQRPHRIRFADRSGVVQTAGGRTHNKLSRSTFHD